MNGDREKRGGRAFFTFDINFALFGAAGRGGGRRWRCGSCGGSFWWRASPPAARRLRGRRGGRRKFAFFRVAASGQRSVVVLLALVGVRHTWFHGKFGASLWDLFADRHRFFKKQQSSEWSVLHTVLRSGCAKLIMLANSLCPSSWCARRCTK